MSPSFSLQPRRAPIQSSKSIGTKKSDANIAFGAIGSVKAGKNGSTAFTKLKNEENISSIPSDNGFLLSRDINAPNNTNDLDLELKYQSPTPSSSSVISITQISCVDCGKEQLQNLTEPIIFSSPHGLQILNDDHHHHKFEITDDNDYKSKAVMIRKQIYRKIEKPYHETENSLQYSLSHNPSLFLQSFFDNDEYQDTRNPNNKETYEFNRSKDMADHANALFRLKRAHSRSCPTKKNTSSLVYASSNKRSYEVMKNTPEAGEIVTLGILSSSSFNQSATSAFSIIPTTKYSK